MRRYLARSNSTFRRASIVESEKDLLGADSAEQSTVASTIQAPLLSPNLKVKRVDYYYSRWSRKWKYQACLYYANKIRILILSQRTLARMSFLNSDRYHPRGRMIRGLAFASS